MSLPPEGATLDDLTGYEIGSPLRHRACEGPAIRLRVRAETATHCVRMRATRRIPLALELAAARMRTLSVSDIERHLDDRFRLLTSGARTAPARQQTLRSLIDWSYELLGPLERTALARLAVFPGDFDLAAAASVVTCSTVEESAVVDLVPSLVDKSLSNWTRLARWGGTGCSRRYRVCSRQARRGAGTRGAAGPCSSFPRSGRARRRAPVRVRSAALARPRQRRGQPPGGLRALNTEPGLSEGALRFGAAVSKFWNSRGYYGDEVDLLTAALAVPTPRGRLNRGEPPWRRPGT